MTTPRRPRPDPAALVAEIAKRLAETEFTDVQLDLLRVALTPAGRR